MTVVSPTLSPISVTILGIRITNVFRSEAIRLMQSWLWDEPQKNHSVFYVNAHTLNLSRAQPSYGQILNRANQVFADGTGVRWAAKMRGVDIKENLVGTDLIPEFLQATSGQGYRVFLLGADAITVERAAQWLQVHFPGWSLAGYHHGYFDQNQADAVIQQINLTHPHLLLVGLGNPLQEIFIDRYQSQLKVPICMGVGGLFDHWGANLKRAPRWVRNLGFEWLQILIQQPKKWRRYLLGNPKFLFQMLVTARQERQHVLEASSSVSGLRWSLKKLARRTMALASWPAVQLAPAGEPSVRVLTYHRFGDIPRDPFCVRASDFEQQMAWLAAQNLAISLADLEAFLVGKQEVPAGAVLVTMDDGYHSVYQTALPILKRYGIPAIAFVTVGSILDTAPLPTALTQHPQADSPERHMTWPELRELSQDGVVVASHGWTHRSFARLDPGEAQQEAGRSRHYLEEKLGQPVTGFAYPFGTLADFNDQSVQMLHGQGYQWAFTSQHGAIARSRAEALTLPRIKVEGGEGLWMFQQLVRGGLDRWRWIDQTLWKLQQSRA